MIIIQASAYLCYSILHCWAGKLISALFLSEITRREPICFKIYQGIWTRNGIDWSGGRINRGGCHKNNWVNPFISVEILGSGYNMPLCSRFIPLSSLYHRMNFIVLSSAMSSWWRLPSLSMAEYAEFSFTRLNIQVNKPIFEFGTYARPCSTCFLLYHLLQSWKRC